MLIEIKHRTTGSVLFSRECGSLKLAVEAAVKIRAYLRGADLRGVNLRGADLDGADLEGAKNIWQSHDLIAEVLRRAAGEDIEKRKLAGLILISRDWCWSKFVAVALDDPLKAWAFDVLCKFGEGDESSMPKEISDALAGKGTN